MSGAKGSNDSTVTTSVVSADANGTVPGIERFSSLYRDIFKVEPHPQELAHVFSRVWDQGLDWERLKSIMEQHPQAGKAEQVPVRPFIDAHDADRPVFWSEWYPRLFSTEAVKFQIQDGKVTYDSADLKNVPLIFEYPTGEANIGRFTMAMRALHESEGRELKVATGQGNVPVPQDVEIVVKHPTTTTKDAIQAFIEKFAGAERVLAGKTVIVVNQIPVYRLAEQRESADDGDVAIYGGAGPDLIYGGSGADLIYGAPKSDAVSLIGQTDRPAETSDLSVQ